MLNVQAQTEKEPLRHLDPEAVITSNRRFAFVGDELDDVLDVLHFVFRPDANSIERV